MTGAVHARPVSHAAAGGKMNPFPNFCRDKDRKVRFEERGKSGGGDGNVDQVKQSQEATMPEKPLVPARTPDGVILKDQQTGELPPFGEHKVQQQAPRDIAALHEGQENRLRGKLKWLFEQDRMYWESNSAKSSLRGSPETDHARCLKAARITTAKKQPVKEPTSDAKLMQDVEERFKKMDSSKPTNDAKLMQDVEERLKKMDSSKKMSFDNLKPPRQLNNKAKIPRDEGSFTDRSSHRPSAKVPWRFTNSTAKFWPRGKPKAQESKKTPTVDSEVLVPAVCQAPVDHSRRLVSNESVTLMSSLDLGGEGFFSDFSDSQKSGDSISQKSGDSIESVISDAEEDEEVGDIGAKVTVVADRGGGRSLRDVKNQAAYLKVKCDMLSKEKNHAVRKWRKSCLEIDEAAKMAQALRTAIETLLEAGASDSRTDFKARQDLLEGQTQALKIRMEKLRRKNSEGLLRNCETTKESSNSLHDRIETLKKTSEGRSLASPEIPRDTEHKVEALRARLEKLMLATNSRVTDEQGQGRRRARAQKQPVAESLQQKILRNEKGELKMKGWLNSLSAELTTEGSPSTSSVGCEKCDGAHGRFILREVDSVSTPLPSKQVTPSTSKQVSPLRSVHDKDRDGVGSAPSSEDTKKMVIHKIAEEVRLEAEQWFQVQELLGRVGEDMKSLQEACSTWERRAILAEGQVVYLQQEGQEKKENTQQLGDQKIAELQGEMLRLRETVEEVRKQLGSISIDPSRWFEAAQNFGYAFMPVNLHLPNTSSAYKGKCNGCDNGTPDSSDHWKEKGVAPTGKAQPSSSTNSSTAPSSICSGEKTPPDGEVKRRYQLPSQRWASEVARAEEDEIMTTTTAPDEFSKFEFVNSTVKEVFPASGGKLLQEKPAKLFHKEPGLEGSGSRGDMLLQMQSSARERCNSFHQEEQLSRYASYNPSGRRSPLRDVLENRASSKENKRPF